MHRWRVGPEVHAACLAKNIRPGMASSYGNCQRGIPMLETFRPSLSRGEQQSGRAAAAAATGRDM
ncbi:MAG: hypothetical protein ACPIOQ_13955 [Promethearchaeia archaeon]